MKFSSSLVEWYVIVSSSCIHHEQSTEWSFIVLIITVVT
jgi:hypothetical protein